MKLTLIAVFFAIVAAASVQAQENFAVGTINRVYVDGISGRALLGVTPQPANTCIAFGEHLAFDTTSPNGARLLAVLLAAKARGGQVHVWYSSSSSPGSNETNGCNVNTISTLQMIGIP